MLLPVPAVACTTVGASGGVVWLTAHLLSHVPAGGADEPPVADVVELVAVGLSRWIGST